MGSLNRVLVLPYVSSCNNIISVGCSQARWASTFGEIPTVSGGQISSFCRGSAGQRVPLKDFSKGPQTSSSKSYRPMTVGRKYDKRSQSIFPRCTLGVD